VKDDPFIIAQRIMTYSGPTSWVEKTAARSLVRMENELGKGKLITSNWLDPRLDIIAKNAAEARRLGVGEDLVIWKFTTDLKQLADADCFVNWDMPTGAEILSCAAIGDKLCLWAIVDARRPHERRSFHVIGTGRSPQADLDKSKFIGTTFFRGGELVLHIFEV
jgi:hypothetical protein